MVENLNKVVYLIGYRYWQIFLIHYRLSEYRLNSISVHHYMYVWASSWSGCNQGAVRSDHMRLVLIRDTTAQDASE